MFDPFVHQLFSKFRVQCPSTNTKPFFKRPVDVSVLAPTFAMFPKRILPCCVLRFLCLLGPICQVLAMVTFLGKTFLLTLSYLARKDCPFGNVTHSGVTRRLNNIFCLGISTAAQFFFHQIFFQLLGQLEHLTLDWLTFPI